jgi:hypothetical protein
VKKNRFKVGDRVVLINALDSEFPENLYQIAVVTTLKSNQMWFEFSCTSGCDYETYEECFELEEIYNSPLYQALKEE